VNRKLKILKLKLDYLKLELEDVKEDFETYTTDFDSYFKKYYDKSQKNNNDNNQKNFENPTHHYENAKREREEQQKKLDEQRSLLKNAPTKVKNLYKKLAAKTHPDKLKDGHKVFQSVKEAYEKQDLSKMLELAGEFGINYDLDKNDERILDKNIKRLVSEIEEIKGTIGWLWGKGNKDQRLFCVERVEKETKLKVKNKDLPEDLRKEEAKLLSDGKNNTKQTDGNSVSKG
tara:strand:+ start:371 stop:1063 length:693 start_codon:yes stop_codon:yes gene_type:complete